MDNSTIITVRKYLNSLQDKGIPVIFGIIFGSYIKGTNNSDSDIDLVIVSPIFDSNKNLKDIGMLWKVAARIDSRIEPIACGEKEWMANDSSIIIEIAHREGIQVEAA
ncbi:MAG: nucleotidyltransferase domain-containing protein [Spirochaetes bacterium]|nr:nucleotidyltransferase domain-containing protein [Spirochaetota bacterium]